MDKCNEKIIFFPFLTDCTEMRIDMELSKIILNAGEALRPALTKIIPMKVNTDIMKRALML